MVCDLNDHLSIGNYESVLSEISSLCIKYNAEYVCIGGDFNTQFSRRESLNTKTILQFICEENLYVPLNHSYANVDYSYSNVSTNTYSIIDPVIVSSNLSDVISSYYSICNDVENQSDHSPIVLELLIDISKHITVPYNSKPCKNWKCANQKDIDMYKTKLDNKLHFIDMPYELLQCNNVLCEIKGHVNCICKLHDDSISACLYASEIIPKTGKISNNIPGCDVELSHEKIIALFWRNIWISMKSPRDGVVSEIMRRTRAQYHYAIRKLKRNAIALRRNTMAESIINNNSRDLGSEIRKVRNTTKTVSTCIDGVTGDINIAELFSNKYNELYNSVRYELQSLNDLFVDNKYDIQAYCIDDANNDMYNHTHCIDVNQIMSAVHELKPGKSDCIDNMYSDNFFNGTYTLYHMISILFTSMLIHGVYPGALLLSTLVPIPKK